MRTSLSESSINLIAVAIDEVCANAIIHGNDEQIDRRLRLKLYFNQAAELVVEVSDKGRPFDLNHQRQQAPTLCEIKQEGRCGGLGLKIVNRVMDRVEYDRTRGYNVCRLYKQLNVSKLAV